MKATAGFVCDPHAPFRLLPNHTSFSTSISRYKRSPIRFHAHNQEIRVCTNRTCRRQGSFQTLETLNGLAPPTITVNSCGCLGKCGAGPNVAVLPDGFVVGHCGTPARAAELMMGLSGSGGGCDPLSVSKSLEALALRKRAETEMEEGDFSQADLHLSQVNCSASCRMTITMLMTTPPLWFFSPLWILKFVHNKFIIYDALLPFNCCRR